MNEEISMKDLVSYIAEALVDETTRIDINEIQGNQTNIIEWKYKLVRDDIYVSISYPNAKVASVDFLD